MGGGGEVVTAEGGRAWGGRALGGANRKGEGCTGGSGCWAGGTLTVIRRCG